MNRITERLAAALRNVDEFCQCGLNSADPKHWDAALNDVLGVAREALAEHDATPTAANLAAQCHGLADALHGFKVPEHEPPSTAHAFAELRRNLHGIGDYLETLGEGAGKVGA